MTNIYKKNNNNNKNMTENHGLVYVGKIVQLDEIAGADRIISATVDCGVGGRWRGVVQKHQFVIDDMCIVYLPDAEIPKNDEMKFMESSNWRVKMRRFKGSPSEVVIMPIVNQNFKIGSDLTEEMGVKKFEKPIPENLSGLAIGYFPSFIPKTDEENYQKVPDLIEMLYWKPFYISVKYDGSSTTAYRYKDNFGVCSRNLEMKFDENNGYWKVCLEHELDKNLPEGIALQFETCGPKIQNNTMGLKKVEGFAFSAYNIFDQKYLEYPEYIALLDRLKFPKCEIICDGELFWIKDVSKLGEGFYKNKNEREGVVIRSKDNLLGHKPVSFKVINLNYEK